MVEGENRIPGVVCWAPSGYHGVLTRIEKVMKRGPRMQLSAENSPVIQQTIIIETLGWILSMEKKRHFCGGGWRPEVDAGDALHLIFGQGLSLNLEFPNSARLTGQSPPEMNPFPWLQPGATHTFKAGSKFLSWAVIPAQRNICWMNALIISLNESPFACVFSDPFLLLPSTWLSLISVIFPSPPPSSLSGQSDSGDYH